MVIELSVIRLLRESIYREKDRNRKVQALKHFFEKNNIRSLEEIGYSVSKYSDNKHIKISSNDFKGIYSNLEKSSLNHLSPKELSVLLIKLGLFSSKINDYDCEVILRRTSDPSYKSFYIYGLEDKDIKRENLKYFKEYYRGYFKEKYIHKEGFRSLEQIGSMKTKGLNKNTIIYSKSFICIYSYLMGHDVKNLSSKELSVLLIKLGLFSSKINDYDCEVILRRTSEPAYKSFYIYGLEDKDIKRENLKYFKEYYRGYFKEKYIHKEGLRSLEQIGSVKIKFPNKNIKIFSGEYKVIYNILEGKNVKKLPSKEFSLLLIKLGLFSPKINDYDCEVILKRSIDPNYKSFYIYGLEDKDIKRENLNYFKEYYRRYFKEKYIHKEGFRSLEQIGGMSTLSTSNNNIKIFSQKFKSIYSTLTNKSIRNLSSKEFSLLLIKLGLFSSKINDYDCEVILKRSVEGTYKSFYLDEIKTKLKDRIILRIREIFSFRKKREDKEILYFYSRLVIRNRKFFKASKAWKDFKRDNKKDVIKRVIKKYELEEVILKLSSSKLSANWKDTKTIFNKKNLSHEEILIRLIEQKEDIFFDIKNNPDFYTELFGRSIGAIKAKINSLMDLSKKKDSFFSNIFGERVSYSFIPFCFEKDPRLENEIVNNSVDCKNGIVSCGNRDTIFIISTQYSYKSFGSKEIIDVLIFSIEYKEKFEDLLDIQKEIVGQAYSKMFNSKETVYPEKFIKIRTSQEDTFLLGVGVRKKFSEIEGQFQAEYETILKLEDGEEKRVETLIFPF